MIIGLWLSVLMLTVFVSEKTIRTVNNSRGYNALVIATVSLWVVLWVSISVYAVISVEAAK